MATIDEQSLTAAIDCIDEQPPNASDLIEQLDQRQNAVMTDLDELNDRIEDLLNECVEANRVVLEEDLDKDEPENSVDDAPEEDADTANAA